MGTGEIVKLSLGGFSHIVIRKNGDTPDAEYAVFL